MLHPHTLSPPWSHLQEKCQRLPGSLLGAFSGPGSVLYPQKGRTSSAGVSAPLGQSLTNEGWEWEIAQPPCPTGASAEEMFYTVPSRNKFITTEQHDLWAIFPCLTSPFPHSVSCTNFQNKLHALKHALLAYLSHHSIMCQYTDFLFPKFVSVRFMLLTQSVSVQETVLWPVLFSLSGIPCPSLPFSVPLLNPAPLPATNPKSQFT